MPAGAERIRSDAGLDDGVHVQPAQPASSAPIAPSKAKDTKVSDFLSFVLHHRILLGIGMCCLAVGIALGVGLGVGLRKKDAANTTTVAASSFNVQLRLAGATCAQQYKDGAVAALKASLQAKQGVAPGTVVVNVANCTEIQSSTPAKRLLAVAAAYMDMTSAFTMTDLAAAKQLRDQVTALTANPSAAAAASDVCATLPGLCSTLQAQGITTTFGAISMSYQETQVPASSLPPASPPASPASPASPAVSPPAVAPSPAPPADDTLYATRFYAGAEFDLYDPVQSPVVDPLLDSLAGLSVGSWDDY